MTIEIHTYRTGTTNTNGSIDADVEIRDDSGEITAEGEITLLRDHQGNWGPWGPCRDYWMSDSLRNLGTLTVREIIAAIDQRACERVEPEVYPQPERIEYDRDGHPV